MTEQRNGSLESLYREKLETALERAKADLAAASQEFDEAQDEMNEILGVVKDQGPVLGVGEKRELAQRLREVQRKSTNALDRMRKSPTLVEILLEALADSLEAESVEGS